MGTTGKYGWPYPDPGTTVDVPRDIKALGDAADLTVWKGSTYAGFRDLSKNANMAHASSALQTFTPAFASTSPAPWTVRAGNQWLDCQAAGTYLIYATCRFGFPTLRATGYIQQAWETAGPVSVSDTMTPQGGSPWADVVNTDLVSCPVGYGLSVRLYNFSGMPANSDRFLIVLVRVGAVLGS